ncbi:MAG: hypothetical protein WB808_00955 [Candidatus Dormiibacterota bacterium]
MPPGRSAATIQPKMTLGALYRCLLDRLDMRLGMRVGIHFEERTSIVAEHAVAGSEPARIEQRTFDADLAVRDAQVVEATLSAGATGAETLVVRVAEVDGGSRYSIAGEGFGVLLVRPDLFHLAAFGTKLESVPVNDAVIDQETPDGSGRIVVDAEIDTDAFARLLHVFDGGQSENPELPLLSHSTVLSAAADVTLDYWWSLLGLDEVEGRPARHNVVVGHVHASFAPLTDAGSGATPLDPDPGLPTLEDLDAVWERARQHRVGS